MKAVLISIQPKWCEKIASGKKTVEVRKTAPKIPTPFKCYIYESLGARTIKEPQGRQKVIGEFVCDFFDEFERGKGIKFKRFMALYEACLEINSIIKYMGEKDKVYGWHISDLKIYGKPKELREFTTPFCPYEVAKCKVGARLCKHYTFEDALGGECDYAHRITRPPQSYMFVEELP